MEEKTSRAVLVAIAENGAAVGACESSLAELSRLLDTAGGVTVAKVIQIKASFDPRTCIGQGKVAEISELVKNEQVDLCVFDFDLSPSQIRNLEEDIGSDVRVIDRSMLILDIFALHAESGEGKLQVELAQLKYSAPRLTGHGTELSRQGGGVGTRGPGESKLETDRRHLKERIHTLEVALSEMEKNRATMRAKRDKAGLPKVAIVGYTNAGKSTLLNRLTDAGVLSEDKLFATLDPTTRRLTLPSGENVLLTDTVGFIRKLPHHLVEAFKSTLDEVRFADILLIVCDATDPECEEQLAVTRGIIRDLDAAEKPVITVFNKWDGVSAEKAEMPDRSVAVSAKCGEGIDDLLSAVERTVAETKRTLTLLIPYTEQGKVSDLYREAAVLSCDYVGEGVKITVSLDAKGRGKYGKYEVTP